MACEEKMKKFHLSLDWGRDVPNKTYWRHGCDGEIYAAVRCTCIWHGSAVHNIIEIVVWLRSQGCNQCTMLLRGLGEVVGRKPFPNFGEVGSWTRFTMSRDIYQDCEIHHWNCIACILVVTTLHHRRMGFVMWETQEDFYLVLFMFASQLYFYVLGPSIFVIRQLGFHT